MPTKRSCHEIVRPLQQCHRHTVYAAHASRAPAPAAQTETVESSKVRYCAFNDEGQKIAHFLLGVGVSGRSGGAMRPGGWYSGVGLPCPGVISGWFGGVNSGIVPGGLVGVCRQAWKQQSHGVKFGKTVGEPQGGIGLVWQRNSGIVPGGPVGVCRQARRRQ